MDARDRLRRYLEQRRELGESEFVLDGMPVEDVLKMVGAKSGARRTGTRADASAPAPTEHAPLERDALDAPPPMTEMLRPIDETPLPPPPAPEVRFDHGASTDWRETLRNAGATKPSTGGVPSGSDMNRSEPRIESMDSSASSGTPASAAAPASKSQSTGSGTRTTLPAWLEALGVPAGLEAGGIRVRDLSPEIAVLPSLQDVAAHISTCQRCALYKTARHAVPGEGNPQAEFLCVGEAPGANEDMQGRPFVGDAGQLLTKILSAIQLSREDVFVHNVLKHRPPGNRDPLPDEVHACQPYLLRQIELVRPRVILALGRFAAQTLLQTTTGIGSLRGQIHRFHGVPMVVTYHPAALLRNEAWKRPTWEDVKLARRVLDAARVAEPTRASE